MEFALDELGECAIGLAAVATQVAEVQVVVLVAEQCKRVVDRYRAQRRIDLVALDLVVLELVQDPTALVGLLRIPLVELEVVLHRLARDAVEVLVERRPITRFQLIPRHCPSFL